MATLVPCPGCARHVRANESACPFCDAAIGDATPRALVPATNDRLFARAALTFAAAAATTLTACGKEPTDKPVPAPTNTPPDNMPAPAYGPPPMMIDAAPEPVPTTTTTATTPSASSSATPAPPHSTTHSKNAPVPAYGVPPINRTPTPSKQ